MMTPAGLNIIVYRGYPSNNIRATPLIIRIDPLGD